MKTILIIGSFCLVLLSACKKEYVAADKSNVKSNSFPASFTQYTIKKGQQYCDKSMFNAVEYSELKFTVKFDSSAIYKTSDPSNQYDINKLYGFSDNDSAHHLYSARFGWRWSDNALRIFAYIYNNGVRDLKELGKIDIGTENNCSIKVQEGHYIFSLNNNTDTLLRTSKTIKGKGYKLYPYFGGDETAPHDITIFIKEVEVN